MEHSYTCLLLFLLLLLYLYLTDRCCPKIGRPRWAASLRSRTHITIDLMHNDKHHCYDVCHTDTHTIQLLVLIIPLYLAIDIYLSWLSTCRFANLLYGCAAVCYCFLVGGCQAKTPCEWMWIQIILTVVHVVEWKSLQTSPSVLDCSIWSPYHSI